MSGQRAQGAGIIGVGAAVPPRAVSNHDLVKQGLDTSDEWIRTRTGISERHIADAEICSSDLAAAAGRAALANAGLSPQDIDLIIVSTSTPDHPLFPSTASAVQHKLGCRKVGAFDLSAACSGFVYGITVGDQFIRSGQCRYVLVIGVDILSRWVDWKDRGICVLFGDGAGAAVLGPCADGHGCLYTQLGADGSGGAMLCTPAGGTKEPSTAETLASGRQFIRMDGKAVFKFASQVIIETAQTALAKCGLEVSDLRLFIPHQANERITQHAIARLGLKPEQVASNISRYGNTSAASIPLALDEYKTQLKDGDVLMLLGFGAGLTWGVNVIRWGGRL